MEPYGKPFTVGAPRRQIEIASTGGRRIGFVEERHQRFGLITFRIDQQCQALADQVFPGITMQTAKSAVHVADHAFPVDQKIAVGGGFQNRLETLVGFFHQAVAHRDVRCHGVESLGGLRDFIGATHRNRHVKVAVQHPCAGVAELQKVTAEKMPQQKGEQRHQNNFQGGDQHNLGKGFINESRE